jgi:hypothetical protein
MSKEPENRSIGTTIDPVRTFLKRFHGRLAGIDAIEKTIRGIARSRGEDWPWVAKWIAEEGPRWSNDMETLVFEIGLEDLIGSTALNFTQDVWMLCPSLFEYQVWGGRAFVRMWWDRSQSAFPGCRPG